MALLLGRDMVMLLSESLEPKLNRRDSHQLRRETPGWRGQGGRSQILCLVPDPPEAWTGLPPGASETQSPGPRASLSHHQPCLLHQGALQGAGPGGPKAGSRPPVIWSIKPFPWALESWWPGTSALIPSWARV